MFDLLLRHARLVDDTVSDIAVKDGKIAALGEITDPAVKPSIYAVSATSAPGGLILTSTATRNPRFIMTSPTASGLPPASPRWWMPVAPALMILMISIP